MGTFSVRSTLNPNSLKKRSRSDLVQLLRQIAEDKRLTNEDVAVAICRLSDRLPAEKEPTS